MERDGRALKNRKGKGGGGTWFNLRGAGGNAVGKRETEDHWGGASKTPIFQLTGPQGKVDVGKNDAGRSRSSSPKLVWGGSGEIDKMGQEREKEVNKLLSGAGRETKY